MLEAALKCPYCGRIISVMLDGGSANIWETYDCFCNEQFVANLKIKIHTETHKIAK